MRVSAISQTISVAVAGSFIGLAGGGCKTPREHRAEADEAAYKIIDQKQKEALGKTEPFTVETPADTLRRRLLLNQNLPYSSDASLGVHDLKPIPHWPKDNYLSDYPPPYPNTPDVDRGPLQIDLLDALTIAAQNSREYQARKEQVFTTALSLDLERDEFRASFESLIGGNVNADLSEHDSPDGNTVVGASLTPQVGVAQRLKNGMILTSRIALDLVKLLTEPEDAAYGLTSDSSVVVPLLRGSGRHIVTEPLTQAERDVVYALLDFEQYKRGFVVQIASQYFSVLQQFDSVKNSEENYRRQIVSARRSRRLSDAGRLPPIQLDQAVQAELRARDSWIRALQQLERNIDQFKVLLGLPPDALIEFDRREFQRLTDRAQPIIDAARVAAGPVDAYDPATQPTTQQLPSERLSDPGAGLGTTQPETRPAPVTQPSDVVLEPPSRYPTGPLEMSEDQAIKIAFESRSDLRAVQGEVFDSQRQVVVAADALRAGLDLTASARFGQGVSPGATEDGQFRPELGSYSGSALLNLPLERTSERNNYRRSLINLEVATRSLQDLEDQIKSDVRSDLRDLLQQRESLINQAKQVQVAQRRVASSAKFFEAGRAQVRDVLESQDALVQAQNSFTSALVNYRISELELQRDLGVLEVNHEGVWQEYSPSGGTVK